MTLSLLGLLLIEYLVWGVEVLTLSTCVWKTVHIGTPFISCDLLCSQVFVNGVIYFRAYDGGSSFNIVISFDFKSEDFGEVCLPERLVHTPSRYLHVAKVNESLGLLEYYNEGDMRVCGVWKREDGANKTNNGEVVIELTDDDGYKESGIEVYEPLSGHTNGVGINGKAWNASEGGLWHSLRLITYFCCAAT
ncbi:zinc finger, CCHC-type containing protein [Tanacetum coccineum]